MVKWTPEQQRAIDEKGSDILVAAAAGSGKTAVLVERIIQKLLNETEQINIDEMLIATFTNAAAEEMRERIGMAIEKALAKNPTSYHLKKQLSLLQRASISTIHSFCMNVVRQYSYVLDLDPAFRIADEMEIELLKHEVLDELFEEWYGGEGEEQELFFAVVDMFSSDRSDARVEELILKLHTFAKQHPHPEGWLQSLVEIYEVNEHTDPDRLPWLNLLRKEIKEQLLSYKETVERAIEIAVGPDGPHHYKEALDNDLMIIENLLERADDWNELGAYFQTVKFKNLSRKSIECSEEIRETVKILRDGYKDNLNKIKNDWFKRSLSRHLNDMEKLYPIVKHLTNLVLQFEHRFKKVKRERTIVDFNDLEHFALAILTERIEGSSKITPSQIANYYENQFKEILVDEYQDINLVQETIIQSISRQKGPGNIFMVGDVKQSIYRFRHAEPTLFIEKYERFEADESKGIRIDLAKNFRSRKDILTGANFIFKQLFDIKIGDITYDDKAALVYGNKGYENHPLKDNKTELIIVADEMGEDNKPTKDKEPDALSEELTKVQLEARIYANKIKGWLGHGEGKPLQVVDKKENGETYMRNIQYRDIVILLRSLTNAPVIVDELKKQGIPVYAELRTGYFQAIEIQVMINMLKVIDNPYQDIPLASVLRSPIVGLNEEDLAQIRLVHKSGSYYEALQMKSKHEDSLGNIIRQFLEQLSAFRQLANEGSLSVLIWDIFQQTGYYDFVGGIPGGRQRQANLRALYDRARSYEETSFRGLFRFLRFIEQMEKKRKDLGAARALSEQEDVVRIMTIHTSKGLEFPVVILGELNKQFNLSDVQGNYITNKELGFATKYIDPVKRITYPTLYYSAVAEEEKRNLLSEEMRVLYVALTRAKEKLVMVGHVRQLEKELKKWRELETYHQLILPSQIRKSAKSYLDWIGPALIRHQDSAIIRESELLGKEVPYALKTDESQWSIELLHADELTDKQETAHVSPEALQKAVTNWETIGKSEAEIKTLVDSRLNFKYKHQFAAESRAKQSVTEIKRRFDIVDEYSDRRMVKQFRKISNERPQFLKATKELTRAEIGTAMHTVMQHIPVDKTWTKSSLSSFVARLVEEEKLTEQEADYIDLAAIEQFFKTELASLMKQHDIKREIPFSYTIDAKHIYEQLDGNIGEKVLIQGVIDCIVITETGIILIDYKTDQINDEVIDELLLEQLKKRYSTQIKLYKQALEDILDEKVIKTYLYFFSRNIIVEN